MLTNMMNKIEIPRFQSLKRGKFKYGLYDFLLI